MAKIEKLAAMIFGDAGRMYHCRANSPRITPHHFSADRSCPQSTIRKSSKPRVPKSSLIQLGVANFCLLSISKEDFSVCPNPSQQSRSDNYYNPGTVFRQEMTAQRANPPSGFDSFYLDFNQNSGNHRQYQKLDQQTNDRHQRDYGSVRQGGQGDCQRQDEFLARMVKLRKATSRLENFIPPPAICATQESVHPFYTNYSPAIGLQGNEKTLCQTQKASDRLCSHLS